jgi:predicted NBD/HSP70 family sugar kinase
MPSVPFEVGHFQVDPNGRQCDCGNRGCVEAYAGRRAIRAIVGELMGGPSDIETIEGAIDLAGRSDQHGPAVLKAFREGGEAIALGIAIALTTFALSHVVIYGHPAMIDSRASRAAAAFMNGIAIFPSRTFPAFRKCQIIPRPLERTIGAQGAALVALSQFFFVPLHDPGYNK